MLAHYKNCSSGALPLRSPKGSDSPVGTSSLIATSQQEEFAVDCNYHGLIVRKRPSKGSWRIEMQQMTKKKVAQHESLTE